MTTLKIFILFFLLSISPLLSLLYATDGLRVIEPDVIAMGGSGVTFSSSLNPAVLAFYSQTDVRLSYLNRYALKELSTGTLDFHSFNHVLPFGATVSSFGFDDYRESLFRLSAGKRLAKRWCVGLSVSYYLVQGKLLEQSVSILSTNIGLLYEPSPSFRLGASLINAPAITVSGKNEQHSQLINYSLQVGFSWELLSGCTLSGQVENSEETTIRAGLGISYEPWHDIIFRLGFHTDPLLPSAGVGYRFQSLQADVALCYHPYLGVSTGLGLTYIF